MDYNRFVSLSASGDYAINASLSDKSVVLILSILDRITPRFLFDDYNSLTDIDTDNIDAAIGQLTYEITTAQLMGGAMILLQTVTLNNGSIAVFDNLSGDDNYIIMYALSNVSGSTSSVSISFNGDTDDNDYAYENLSTSPPDAVSSFFANGNNIFQVVNNGYLGGQTNVYQVPHNTNRVLLARSTNNRVNASDNILIQDFAVQKNTPVASLQKITLTSSVNITGKISLYRVVI